MTDYLNPTLDANFKGFPHTQAPLTRAQVAEQGWNVLRGDLPLPLAVIRTRALDGNLRWLQDFATTRGLHVAPHGKTTMSPQLFRRQLDAGAWGITFANVQQAQVGVQSGVRRCLIANQVLASVDLAGIQQLLRAHADLRILFLMDSAAQLDLVEAHFAADPAADKRPFEVLLEVGLANGRTGARHHEDAIALARRIHASAAVRLAGIECYEGLQAKGESHPDTALADGIMSRVKTLAEACDAERLFDGDEVVISAGGSAIFDLVAPWLLPKLSLPVRGVLRSGCYVTHDNGSYQRYMNVMATRLGCEIGLSAAMEVWTTVQSRPEPGLAIVTAGRRDVGMESAMPVPVRLARRGSLKAEAPPAHWKLVAFNDQHGYLRGNDGETLELQVGDRIALGISHPCTTFDKWRWMALVDEDYNVRDAIVTQF